jgi:amino acid transporter
MEFPISRRKLLSWTACSVGATSILFGGIHTFAILCMDKSYDRDLVFLLSAGGILIFCGLLNIISTKGVKKNERLANVLSILSTVFLIAFCLSLTPFFRAKLNYFLIGIHCAYLLLFVFAAIIEKRGAKFTQ